jgi:hypothetical protein
MRMQNLCATTSGGHDVNITKKLTLGGYYWPPSSKGNLLILGVARNVVTFFWLLFFLRREKKFWFHVVRGRKILQYSPYLGKSWLVVVSPAPSTGSHRNSRPRPSLYFYFFVALFDPRKRRANFLHHMFCPDTSPLQLPPHHLHIFFGLTLLNFFHRRHCIC